MEGLPVSYSLNSGDNGNNWWGDFIGAAIGGAAGAAWGRGNNNGCCGNGGGGCCNNNDQFNTALAAGNAQQTRNEMQGQTALILAALRDRTPASSGGASA